MIKNKKSKIKGLGSTAMAIFVAMTIRWGVAEAYFIPSASMEPTLQINDRIFVNKLAYGVRLPFTKLWLTKFQDPKRGDVVVFKYPVDESIYFIKRVIGLPGDEIEYSEKGELFINQRRVDESKYETKLVSSIHRPFGPVRVPKNQLFVMGDNRDNSSDSRFWGFLPEENIIGKAAIQWFGFIR